VLAAHPESLSREFYCQSTSALARPTKRRHGFTARARFDEPLQCVDPALVARPRETRRRQNDVVESLEVMGSSSSDSIPNGPVGQSGATATASIHPNPARALRSPPPSSRALVSRRNKSQYFHESIRRFVASGIAGDIIEMYNLSQHHFVLYCERALTGGFASLPQG